VCSGAMMCIPSFLKIVSRTQKTQTEIQNTTQHRKHVCIFGNQENTPNMKENALW
jgi:hypothetical protein